ncbi:hypothetical protein BpHYR1_010377 [Brachionus plicatilis]|uniref:Uncharacterized protein n=1 Tax=Brachionus plicatilis TaxID=10195 RepID=A0A3M7SWA1_BRAPC|nr:hypothetical protein BpHYR1_010377 [Brachionus plicatilis]
MFVDWKTKNDISLRELYPEEVNCIFDSKNNQTNLIITSNFNDISRKIIVRCFKGLKKIIENNKTLRIAINRYKFDSEQWSYIKTNLIETIKDFKVHIYVVKDDQKLKKAKKVNWSFNLNRLWMPLLFLLVFIPGLLCQNLNDRFRFCMINDNSPLVHVQESCHLFHDTAETQNKEYFMLEKRDNVIEGYGYICTKSRITVKTWKNFWNIPKKLREEQKLIVSKEQCQIMVLSKKCEDQELSCENNICNSINEPEEKYEYFN